jgi:signal transduction histidine kinase
VSGRTEQERASTIAGRAKQKDLARLAHDLRTPLSAVLMWVRLLRAGSAPDPAAALAAIEASAVELSRALDKLSRAPAKKAARRRDQDAGGRDLRKAAKRETVSPSPRAAAPKARRPARPRGSPARG